MILISLLGFIAIIFSIFYLSFHFIKKGKDKERKLSKKFFYSTLIGGFAMFIIGSILHDKSYEAQLHNALEQNESLTTDYYTLTSENNVLIQKVSTLESDIEEMTSNVTEYESNIEEEKAVFNTEKELLNEEITDLNDTNTNLKDEVASLESKLESTESKLASAESDAQRASASSSTSSNSNSRSGSSEPTSSSSNVYFENCTAARNAGAAPVRSGDPGYASHLDRDGDGIGCE
ncbi:excalibur calcium-binding domain-containing protein [Oceanobacillus longus]|uniref:Excalibur calcium-binding domain-containing protein n=1 Tax=Oceanobacillus longus TaxID=930120 RepID=A0ABV8GZ44_9BACI